MNISWVGGSPNHVVGHLNPVVMCHLLWKVSILASETLYLCVYLFHCVFHWFIVCFSVSLCISSLIPCFEHTWSSPLRLPWGGWKWAGAVDIPAPGLPPSRETHVFLIYAQSYSSPRITSKPRNACFPRICTIFSHRRRRKFLGQCMNIEAVGGYCLSL